MKRNYYTLDDLYKFCSENNYSHFDATTTGAPLVVYTQGKFDAGNPTQGLIPVTLQACHTELNANQSYISKETMTTALPSLYNRPILGNIIEKDDGTYDFGSHDMEVRQDEDGNEYTYYIEQPIGVIPESGDAKLEYDEDKEKTYVKVNGYIYEDYANHVADILNERKSVDVSVELYVTDMSFSVKDKCLIINDFYFNGVTCLGETVQPGMKGSNLTLTDFVAHDDEQSQNEKLTKEAIDKFTSSILKAQKQEGGNGNMDNEQTATDVEELENATAEENKNEEEIDSEEITLDNDGSDDNDDKTDEADLANYTRHCEVTISDQKFARDIELSDIIYSLECLVNHTYADDDTYYSVHVYDNYVVMEDWWNGRYFRQQYESDESNNYSLIGERIEVFKNYLSKEEMDKFAEMNLEYEKLREYAERVEAEKLRAEKIDDVIHNADYNDISQREEFKELEAHLDEYSLEDLRVQADLLLAKFAKEQKHKDEQIQIQTYAFSGASQVKESSFLEGLLEKSK